MTKDNPPGVCDPGEIVRSLRIILEPGQVTEVRALNAITNADRRPHTESGYFDDVEKLARAVQGIRSATGIYFVPNPLNSALLSRAWNRIRPVGREPTSADHDVILRYWLLLDFDAVRPSGISATDEEHRAALERAETVREQLAKEGWPSPFFADSGNGGHLPYRIGIPAEDDGLIQKCLEALAVRFDTPEVTIDRSVHNPARIWKLPGTWACKGDSTPDRPHRLARIIEAPAEIQVVPRELLERLAATAPDTAKATDTRGGDASGFDIDAWIRSHGLNVTGPVSWNGGRRWVFIDCPWNPDHTNRSAYIIQHPSGAISAGCHHNGCAGKGWHHLRDVVEPGWKERRSAGSSRGRPVSPPQELPWPDPKPLPASLPPVKPFDFELLPESFRPGIADIAERMQCPPDFPAVAAMVGLAAVVGRKIGIRPKRRDDWQVVPNLWGAAIGRPGILKTPAIQEPLRPLRRLEIKAKERYEACQRDNDAAKIVATQKKKLRESDIKKALQEGTDAHAIALSMLSEEQSAPVRKRYLVNDSTVEKLGELLNENPNGVLVFRDELTGFLRSLDKDGQEGARAFYLEAWNGTGRYTYDRIGRGTIDIEAAIVSVLGGIQPGPLESYLNATVSNGMADDGLLQRFQLCVYPDVSRDWRNVDQWPDSAARDRAFDVFDWLDTLAPAAIGAEVDGQNDGIPFLRFADVAQAVFDEWRAKLECRVRSGEEHPAFESHLSKYRSLIPSLALLVHLADQRMGPIGLDSLNKAIAWGAYLESHARRIYAIAINPDAALAKALALRISAGDLNDGFTSRDVYRHGWSLLSRREDAEQAVGLLLDLGWLRETKEPTGGAPRTLYWINPNVAKLRSDGTDTTAKSRSEQDLAALSVPQGRVASAFTEQERDETDNVNRVLDEAAGTELDEEMVEWAA